MKAAAEAGKIPRYGIPDAVVIVDTLAKTSVGKLNKKQMRQDFAQRGN